MITANPLFADWSQVVSVNCSDPFAPLSIAFCKNIPLIFCGVEKNYH